ncbi:TRAP transporter small permease [Desertibacillus haloalkaliphilus]|uniref:TRAP transporter small permease n=1 Tax=Desertibacillus haloalkaliphilus TaxID=1328930 RepID=UPI001C25AEE8|nr:TRAP transporter small permease [Desertibacillus haloalkaliphilus]MBU8905125.1 TRAP transporter small permease [Desertibacillus haloalkaliphilus]
MGKIIATMNQIIKYFLIVILTVLIVAVFCQVLFRFVLNQPLAWTEELARYCLIWITFLGAAYAMSLKSHIGMSILVEKSPLLLRRLLTVIAAIVCIGFFWLMIQQGFHLSERSMNQLSPVLRIPMGAIYLVIPISGIVLTINLVAGVFEDLRRGEEA